MKPYVVGIAGGSASGKTYLLSQLLAAFTPQQLTLMSLDNYYKPASEQPRNAEGEINWDQPQALDLELCKRHLSRLIKGRRASVQEWTFNNPNATPRTLQYLPAPILVLEGLFVYNDPELRRLFDLKVFIDAEEHVKLSRRIRRDLVERNSSLEEILSLYETHVVPMYHQHVEPFKYACDLILPNNSVLGKGVEVLVSHLRLHLQGRPAYESLAEGSED